MRCGVPQTVTRLGVPARGGVGERKTEYERVSTVEGDPRPFAWVLNLQGLYKRRRGEASAWGARTQETDDECQRRAAEVLGGARWLPVLGLGTDTTAEGAEGAEISLQVAALAVGRAAAERSLGAMVLVRVPIATGVAASVSSLQSAVGQGHEGAQAAQKRNLGHGAYTQPSASSARATSPRMTKSQWALAWVPGGMRATSTSSSMPVSGRRSTSHSIWASRP